MIVIVIVVCYGLDVSLIFLAVVDVMRVDMVAIVIQPHVPICVIVVDMGLMMGLLDILSDSIAEIESKLPIAYLQNRASAQLQ